MTLETLKLMLFYVASAVAAFVASMAIARLKSLLP